MSDILVEARGAIATVVFNRPRVRNAVTLAIFTYDYLATVADNAPLSVRGAKETVEAYLAGLTPERRERLRALARKSTDSEDYREGTRAILEKRPPRFQGR